MIESEIIQALSSGADVATLCIFYLFWRLEKRVFELEIKGRDKK